MKIFPKNPTLSDKDRARLNQEGYLQSWNKFVARINNVDLSQDDLKRLVFLELEQDAPRKAILAKLVVRIQKKEREAIIDLIRRSTKGKTFSSSL